MGYALFTILMFTLPTHALEMTAPMSISSDTDSNDNESLLAQQQWEQGSSRPSCDWMPRDVIKLDAFNCGRTDSGQPIRALYQCGKAADCSDKCFFIKCFSGP